MFQQPELYNFIINHYYLCSILLLLLLLLGAVQYLILKRSARPIHPAELVNILNKNIAQIVDIRNASDYKKMRISGSINIDITAKQNLDKLKQYSSKTIVLIGDIHTIHKYTKILQAANYKYLLYLKGGIPAWQDAGLPVIIE